MNLLGHKHLLGNRASKSTAWSLINPTYAKYWNMSTTSCKYPMDIHFSSDGLKLYVAGRSYSKVVEFHLSTAWDITTSTFYKELSVSAQTSNMWALDFKPDGTRLYVLDGSVDYVYQYNLSTAWKVTTASYIGRKASPADPIKFTFRPDGYACFIINKSGYMRKYNLSTAWQITTMSYSSVYKSNSLDYGGFIFNLDGTKLFITDWDTDVVDEFSLSTAYDITKLSLERTFNLPASWGINPYTVRISPDGLNMYIHQGDWSRILQFNL